MESYLKDLNVWKVNVWNNLVVDQWLALTGSWGIAWQCAWHCCGLKCTPLTDCCLLQYTLEGIDNCLIHWFVGLLSCLINMVQLDLLLLKKNLCIFFNPFEQWKKRNIENIKSAVKYFNHYKIYLIKPIQKHQSKPSFSAKKKKFDNCW